MPTYTVTADGRRFRQQADAMTGAASRVMRRLYDSLGTKLARIQVTGNSGHVFAFRGVVHPTSRRGWIQIVPVGTQKRATKTR